MERINESSCKEVFDLFQQLNQVPRASHHEEKVSEWLVSFAKEHDLEVIQDEALNVIIKKPGTEGYEDSETIILQGHMDMVAEKGEGSDHDFSKDPIEFIVDGDFVRANNTTLGADNGIAVAYALAILVSEDIPHPPLEVLITTNEENGMDGAFALDPSHLQGRRLINIDSEVEGELLVSCAGGIGSVTSLPISKKSVSLNTVVEIKATDFIGGHSGLEINKQRGNATQILARILRDTAKDMEFELVSIDGGSKHNAIPRNAMAKICVAEENVSKFEELAQEWTQTIETEFHNIENGAKIVVSQLDETIEEVMDQDTRDKALAIICLTPTGIVNMSTDIEGLVQTSNNLGVVTTHDDKVTFESTTRSSVRTMKFDIAGRIEQIADALGATVEFDQGYPEWQFAQESKLRDVFAEAYKEQYGKDPVITAIHAGLECGVFSEKFDGKIDLVSFGPNLFEVHTAGEKMDIASVERTYDHLKLALSKLK